ncbi:flagellar assembly peptidoglycan hydrolase FlgJ [Aquincola sp. MAHUQ-54]|uniref:Flagellar assembly peptidoglycan hydrolase FlgJ n=1 Tax=Aquincola agrisoli TaxID=3119538 RepID=A0AAW9QE18_9BURK
MLRPELAFPAATPATQATAPLSAVAPALPTLGGGRFSQHFARVDGEIRDYIANGSPEGDGVPALSAAGRAYMASLQDAGGGLTTASALAAIQGSGSLADAAASTPEHQAFLGSIAPWAAQAGQQLGVAPDILAAHAALESGWGQRPLRQAAGSSTNNLFGIKAGSSWRGDSADAMTTEYEQGVATKRTERFRSYADTASAFQDFAKLIQNNPRYEAALNTGTDVRAYADALARGGYATDPNYANKLVSVVNRLRSRPSAAEAP